MLPVLFEEAITLIEKVTCSLKANDKRRAVEETGERIQTKTPDGDIHGKNDCLYLLFDYT